MWSLELGAAEMEMRVFRMKKKERIEIDKHVTDDKEIEPFSFECCYC